MRTLPARLTAGLITALFALLAFSSPALGADDSALVITATRTPQEIGHGISPTILIDRETIAASQAQDAAELLRFVAGLEIGRNGGPGQATSLFIRGTDSNHALVLVDGVPMNPGTIGGAALQNLDPQLIERIEIVKGPRSSQYGSAALGGVVHIITRRPTATGAEVNLATGSDASHQLGAQLRHVAGSISAELQVNERRSDGFPARVGSSRNSGHRMTSAKVFLRHQSAAGHFELRHWQATGNTEYDGFFLEPLDQDFRNTSTALEAEQAVSDRWLSRLTVSETRDEIDQGQGADFTHTRRRLLDWQNDVEWRGGLLSGGISLSREDTRALSFGLGFDESTDTRSAFLQNERRWSATGLLLAARMIDHEDFGAHHTGEISLRRELTPDAALHLSWASGFRAPDATDRFGFGGNPALEPETSSSIEAGLRVNHGMLRWQASVFRNDLDQLIAFIDPDGYAGPLPGRNENIDRARIDGLEVSLQAQREAWQLRAEVMLSDPENRDTGRQLPRRARAQLVLAANYTGRRLAAGARLLAVGSRPDSDFNTVRNPGYGVIDVHARYPLAGGTLGLRVENLLDNDYVLSDGFQTGGRRAFLEWRWSR
ncbi:MAG: TonB-dependent receptor [Gammaproteobacteria bacterium]|nr:TonB-dependent receptor [Gammaproteobacteria bacterium]